MSVHEREALKQGVMKLKPASKGSMWATVRHSAKKMAAETRNRRASLDGQTGADGTGMGASSPDQSPTEKAVWDKEDRTRAMTKGDKMRMKAGMASGGGWQTLRAKAMAKHGGEHKRLTQMNASAHAAIANAEAQDNAYKAMHGGKEKKSKWQILREKKLKEKADKKAAKEGKIAPEELEYASGSAGEGDIPGGVPSDPDDNRDVFAEDEEIANQGGRKASVDSVSIAAIAKPQNVRRASLTEEDFHAFEHAYGSARTPPLDGGEQGDAESDFLAGAESDTPSDGWESEDGDGNELNIPNLQQSGASGSASPTNKSGVTSTASSPKHSVPKLNLDGVQEKSISKDSQHPPIDHSISKDSKQQEKINRKEKINKMIDKTEKKDKMVPIGKQPAEKVKPKKQTKSEITAALKKEKHVRDHGVGGLAPASKSGASSKSDKSGGSKTMSKGDMMRAKAKSKQSKAGKSLKAKNAAAPPAKPTAVPNKYSAEDTAGAETTSAANFETSEQNDSRFLSGEPSTDQPPVEVEAEPAPVAAAAEPVKANKGKAKTKSKSNSKSTKAKGKKGSKHAGVASTPEDSDKHSGETRQYDEAQARDMSFGTVVQQAHEEHKERRTIHELQRHDSQKGLEERHDLMTKQDIHR